MSAANRHRPTLADVVTTTPMRPSIGVVYAPEGTGKTSLGTYAPNPVFLMSPGETGLQTLLSAGRVPPTAHFPELTSLDAFLGAVEVLLDGGHPYRTVVVDTLNGLERLVHEHVCRRDFGGRWGRDGFTAYNTGYE